MRGYIIDGVFGKEVFAEDGTRLGTVMETAVDGMSRVYGADGGPCGYLMEGGVSDQVYYSDDGQTTLYGFESPLGGMSIYQQGELTGYTSDGLVEGFELNEPDGFSEE